MFPGLKKKIRKECCAPNCLCETRLNDATRVKRSSGVTAMLQRNSCNISGSYDLRQWNCRRHCRAINTVSQTNRILQVYVCPVNILSAFIIDKRTSDALQGYFCYELQEAECQVCGQNYGLKWWKRKCLWRNLYDGNAHSARNVWREKGFSLTQDE